MSRSASLINVPLRFKISVEICRVDHGLIGRCWPRISHGICSCADACFVRRHRKTEQADDEDEQDCRDALIDPLTAGGVEDG